MFDTMKAMVSSKHYQQIGVILAKLIKKIKGTFGKCGLLDDLHVSMHSFNHWNYHYAFRILLLPKNLQNTTEIKQIKRDFIRETKYMIEYTYSLVQRVNRLIVRYVCKRQFIMNFEKRFKFFKFQGSKKIYQNIESGHSDPFSDYEESQDYRLLTKGCGI